ncbi:hypothetical protein [Brochothrix thermosphacta]|uniref:Uncharacterized protein n=1 Tax=Brochothrix thermosphacta TaxID=2756 RepID=A0A2X0QIM3_BROTH|nr:hypothetical protein [Brochothrix thermosphacta]ODJ71999.1 hypothetical protein BFR39_04480 [Brochothrix thermosphacta]SPP28444.1 conserved hypothetical protein [Brochothrix thermosphacta]
MRYMITNANKIQFLKQLREVRKKGNKVLKVKQETKTRSTITRDDYMVGRYKDHKVGSTIIYKALIEMSDEDARACKDTQN